MVAEEAQLAMSHLTLRPAQSEANTDDVQTQNGDTTDAASDGRSTPASKPVGILKNANAAGSKVPKSKPTAKSKRAREVSFYDAHNLCRLPIVQMQIDSVIQTLPLEFRSGDPVRIARRTW